MPLLETRGSGSDFGYGLNGSTLKEVVLSYTTGLTHWYDVASPASVTIVGSKVSSILDKSGNSRHITQSTDSKRPLYLSSTLNGRPVMEFTSANQTVLNMANAFAFGTSNFHIFAVVRPKQASNSEQGGFFGAEGNSNNLAYCFPGQTGPYQTFLHGSVAWIGGANTTLSTSSYYQLNGSKSGSTIAYRMNRNADGPGTSYSTNISGSTNAVGCQEAGSYFNGYLGELLVFNAPVTGANLTTVETYLNTKWGV
jgi:hypothetical protein